MKPNWGKLNSNFIKSYNDRDTTIGQGFVLGGAHFEVHRFHPPLIYGRKSDTDKSEGISLAKAN